MSTANTEPQQGGYDERESEDELLIVDADGNPVTADKPADADEQGGEERYESDPIKLVPEPAKVMRIGSMIKQLLEEVRAADLDDKGRQRLADIHARSIAELESGLAPELRAELERL